ncbi:type II secretion system protein [Cerasicoccus frondis]|uniref:type II secretion system protein n=1 Tax=Cerasicoccus frondis TaxID=490090 RepID=UPI002852D141|nr:hypothetical protein [Cerasicoccus frondis]
MERAAGFTLVEIMTLVVIIGLLAIMAMPAFQKARIGAQNSRLARDLQTFSAGFEQYSLDAGKWPPEANAGELPEGMGGYITGSSFSARTVVGGRYDWNFQNGTYQAGVAIVESFLDDDQAQQVDAIIDDGNLSMGRFQKDGEAYVLILAP